MKHPSQFSVSMCVYEKDDPVFFAEAVQSLLSQSVPPAEIVLVVDGPVPEAIDQVISSYENGDTFRVIRLPVNRGHGEARRIGLTECRYEIVALMDADDVSVPDRFEKQLAVLREDPSVSIVGGKIAEFIGERENVIGYRTVPESHEAICAYLKERCPFNQITVMFRKSEVERAGGFLDWYCDEDYYLWVRMYLAGARFANLPDTLAYVRVSEDMYKRRGGLRYFKSERALQKYMRKAGVITWGKYLVNVAKRLILQVLMPNSLRSFIFKRFAREKS